MKYWLFKSEPDVYSIDHLKDEGFATWDGVRNYQARNYLRDEIKYGDLILFYHSNHKPPGVAGIGRVCEQAFPDASAFDPKNEYFDPKSTPKRPLWYAVEVEFVEKFPHYVTRDELRKEAKLKEMVVMQKGSRLSITPVTKKEFDLIKKLGSVVPVEAMAAQKA